MSSLLIPRFRAPLILARAQDNAVSLEVWGPTGRQEPTSGTLSIYDADDTVIVNAAAITVSGGKATYTVLAASVPATLELSDSWRAVWSLSIGGNTEVFHQDAQLVRRAWRPSVTALDLFTASPQLRNSYNPDTTEDNQALYDILMAAIEDTQARLVENGMRPWLIFEQWRLNRYVVQLTLGRIYRSHLFDQASENTTQLDTLATHHEEDAEKAWDGMNFRYDSLETGKGSDMGQRKAPATIRIGITR